MRTHCNLIRTSDNCAMYFNWCVILCNSTHSSVQANGKLKLCKFTTFTATT